MSAAFIALQHWLSPPPDQGGSLRLLEKVTLVEKVTLALGFSYAFTLQSCSAGMLSPQARLSHLWQHVRIGRLILVSLALAFPYALIFWAALASLIPWIWNSC